jgi:mannose-1-phosphate guanylyltransferase/mannose-1-phosphate guanylyltransferase/mannose-6-phosphate isomerase
MPTEVTSQAGARRRTVPVILAGGTGTRLWPLSTERLPKQFQKLIAGQSTYQLALRRVGHQDRFETPIVVTGTALKELAEAQAAETGIAVTMVLESHRRDSAPAIAAASALVEAELGGALVLTLAADHVIQEQEAFLMAVDAGVSLADQGFIVTFGVEPKEPATTFGYIRPGAETGSGFAVRQFIEKPDRDRAASLIAEGCLWNSGNFLFDSKVMLAALDAHAPQVSDAARRSLRAGLRHDGIVSLDAQEFSSAPRISIDYAVMEKVMERLAVVPGRFRWLDIGSWEALAAMGTKDGFDNVVEGDAALVDARSCLVRSDGPVVGAVGVEDLIIVVNKGRVLVAARGNLKSMKALVEEIERVEARRQEST